MPRGQRGDVISAAADHGAGMLISMPHLMLSDWRQLFSIDEDFADETLEQLWHTGDKRLREKIFHCRSLKLTEEKPDSDWMIETLAEFLAKLC